MVITNNVCWYGHVLKWEDGYHQLVNRCLLVWSCVEVGGWLSPTVFVGMVMGSGRMVITNNVCWYGHVLKGWLSPTMFVGMVMC